MPGCGIVSGKRDPTRIAPVRPAGCPTGPAGEGPASTALRVPAPGGDTPFVPSGPGSLLAAPSARAAGNGSVHQLIALFAGSPAVACSTNRAFMHLVDFRAQPCDPFLTINTPPGRAEVHALAVQLEERA